MSSLRRRRILTGVTLLITSVVIGTNVQDVNIQACGTISECSKSIDGAKNRREQLQKQMNELKSKQNTLAAEVYNLRLQVATFTAQIDAATKTIEALEIQSNKLEQSMKETEALLRKRLTDMQLSHETNKSLDFIANSSSITEMVERAQAVQALTKSDQELIQKYDNQKKDVDRNREDTIKTKNELEVYKVEKEKLIQENNAKIEQYKKENEELEKNSQHAKDEQSLSESQLDSIRNAASNVPRYSGSGAKAPFDGGYPMRHAVLTSSYAESQFHSIPHNGTDYAPLGDPTVYSMVDGVVVANKFNSARGWLVAIAFNDGAGWKTLLYQHLAGQSSAPIGSTVKRGQAVGTAGNTGKSSGVHLHSEVGDAGGGPSWVDRGASAGPGLYATEHYFSLPSSW